MEGTTITFTAQLVTNSSVLECSHVNTEVIFSGRLREGGEGEDGPHKSGESGDK